MGPRLMSRGDVIDYNRKIVGSQLQWDRGS